MELKHTGILGLISLVIMVYVIIQILGSGASNGHKVLWIVLVVLLPFLGAILWWFMGPKS